MSTESGDNSRRGAANGSDSDPDNTDTPLGSDGGRIRNRSDRLSPADETQALPTRNAATSDAPATGATAAGASAASADGPAGQDDGGRTRSLPLSATKDPHQDDAPDDTTGADGAGHGHDVGRARRDGSLEQDRRTAAPDPVNREALLAMEKERFGGIKFGAAFFGWLTATGMVILLSALAAAIGAAVGFSTDTDLGQSLDQAMANQSAGIIGVIVLLVILLLAYYAGGYVAGRMARFNGLKQGLAVWIWALIAGVVVVVLGLIYGNDIRSITQLNTVAPLPEDLDGATAATWIAVAATLAATLIGALLGGLAGMRYHRRIDRADFSGTDVRA